MRIEVRFPGHGGRIDVHFREQSKRFEVCLGENRASLNVDFGNFHTLTKLVGGEPYEEDYEVIPKTTPQTLRTKYMVMTDDLTIQEIPYSEVSNTSGGTTATIG